MKRNEMKRSSTELILFAGSTGGVQRLPPTLWAPYAGTCAAGVLFVQGIRCTYSKCSVHLTINSPFFVLASLLRSLTRRRYHHVLTDHKDG